jgi:hypothetical protein
MDAAKQNRPGAPPPVGKSLQGPSKTSMDTDFEQHICIHIYTALLAMPAASCLYTLASYCMHACNAHHYILLTTLAACCHVVTGACMYAGIIIACNQEPSKQAEVCVCTFIHDVMS